jgi:hypothetical protein
MAKKEEKGVYHKKTQNKRNILKGLLCVKKKPKDKN